MSSAGQTPSKFARLGARLHAALSHDFCPGANRWVYWLKNPFWVVLTATLTAIVCGLFVSVAMFVFGAALLGLLALGVLWPWLTMRGVSARLHYEQSRCREGEPIAVEIEVTNRWPWPVWGLRVHQGMMGDAAAAGNDLVVAMVAGWSVVTHQVIFRPPQRGVYPVETPRMESGFPFGLYLARRRLMEWNQLIVWPSRAILQSLPDAVEIESREDRTSDRRAGDVGDVLGTRWFRQGDPLRRVHWAQSARQGRLIVCERQTPVSCALRLVLDLDPAQHGGRGGEASIERLLRVAASIVESMHTQHAYVECVIGHETYAIGPAAQDLRRCLDALAAIPVGGVAECHDHGLCCGSTSRHRSMSEFLLTTERGFARRMHDRHWSENHHYIVVGAPETPTPAACHDHTHCVCKPWLELPADADVLAVLPRRWQGACRVA